MPDIQVSMMAVIVAVFASFIFGFIWYTPLFGKLWAKEMGFDPDEKPPTGPMIMGMVFMLIGNFLLAWVLGHNMAAYDPVSWGMEPSGASPISTAGMAAFFTYIGFFLPVDIGVVTWERKSWTLFGINTSYHFLNLLLVASILSYI